MRYLSTEEQKIFSKALRRSVRVIYDPKQEDNMVRQVGNLFIPTAEEVSPTCGAPLEETKYEPFPYDSYHSDLRPEDRVKIVRLGKDQNGKPCQYEGKTGTLVGIAIHEVMIYWIIKLDEYTTEPYGYPLSCVMMPSVCLEKIE